MKKVVFLLILITLSVVKTSAANYELKELIPANVGTTIVTDNFSYKQISYNPTGTITVQGIKNLTDEKLPISISIALFDEDKKNVGIVNYCSKDNQLASKEERSLTIEVTSDYLGEEKTIQDIKYIAILSDNINCRVTGSTEYIGKTIDKITLNKNSIIDSNAEFVLNIFKVIIIILVAIFIYKFLFTNAYTNFNGDDIRDAYAFENKKLKAKRKNNPSHVEKKVKHEEKSDVIKQQELNEARKENKEESDLHNFYK